MAARRKPVPAKPAPSAEGEKPAAEPEADKPESRPRAPKKSKSRPKRRVRRSKSRKAATRKLRAARSKPARARHRGRYSNAERARILAAAEKGGLTALQVEKKFGVRPVTYYSWQKKTKATPKRRPRRVVQRQTAASGLAAVVRESVQERLRAMLPGIVRGEVVAYLGRVFGKRL